jgi:hypothetical protein
MDSEIILCFERFTTHGATVLFGFFMNSLMLGELRFATEAFTTLRTLVWHFLQVRNNVNHEVSLRAKLLVTNITLYWHVSGM